MVTFIDFATSELSKHVSTLNDFYEHRNVVSVCKYLNEEDQKVILQANSNYLQQILLKEKISNLLTKPDNKYEIYKWIVNVWGGIREFNVDNRERIDAFLNSLNSENVKLNQISSLSKIASFVNPNKYFIYDSRVAFSLNALMIKYYQKNHKYDSLGFFFLPTSTNNREIIMADIIWEKTKGQAVIFDKKKTYQKYCEIVKALYPKLFPEDKDCPFKVEMLLFMLADIVEDWFEIKNRRIMINALTKLSAHPNDNANKKSPRNSLVKKKAKNSSLDIDNNVTYFVRGFLTVKNPVKLSHQLFGEYKPVHFVIGEKIFKLPQNRVTNMFNRSGASINRAPSKYINENYSSSACLPCKIEDRGDFIQITVVNE